jgi:hypothetical protein
MAGAVAAALLAWGQGAHAADAKQERREAAEATKAEARQEGREARDSMNRAADRTRAEAQQGADRTGAQAGRMSDDKKHPLFEGKNNFDIDGKVAKVSANSITIQRNELPEATLHVSKNTKVEVDGKQVSTQQLQRGQDVKASFNLHGDKAEAVEIKADKLAKDDRKEMGEQRRETQEQLQERQQKAQQR